LSIIKKKLHYIRYINGIGKKHKYNLLQSENAKYV